MTYLAQTPLGPIGQGTGFGPWASKFWASPTIDTASSSFVKIISNIIGIMTIISGIWFIFMFITGAFSFLTAGGNSENISKATKKIGTSLIGLVVVVAAYAILSLLGQILGFDLLNPQDIITKLGP